MGILSRKLIDVLRANKVYLENTDIIDQYFQAFSGILEESGWKLLDKISPFFHMDNPNSDPKEYLNSKLTALKFTVYLIVDDLDRCSQEYKSKMFKVIRESTQLNNCKTIFLANREAFLDEKCDNQYIEKYIGYQLELRPVEYAEIINEYWEIIFDSAYFSGIQESVWHDRTAQKLCEEILGLPRQFINLLMKMQSDLKRQRESQNMEACVQTDADIMFLENTVNEIKTGIVNSRKVKNYLKGIRSDIKNLNTAWNDSYSNTYFDADWIMPIIRVQFLKCFFPDDYWKLYLCNSITEYQGTHAGWIKKFLLENSHTEMTPGTLEEILNLIIYQLDVLDFEKNKTAMQLYLDELRGSTPDIAHMNQYLQYITMQNHYSDYQKLLELYNEQYDKLSRTQIHHFINTLLQKLSKEHITEWGDFLHLSESVIASLKNSCLSASEISGCGQQGRMIICNCLEWGTGILKIPVETVFGIYITEESDYSFAPSDFRDVYHWLQRIDENADYHDGAGAVDELAFVQQYYKQLESKIKTPQYARIYPHIRSDMENCQLLFQVCRLWSDVAATLKSPADTDTILSHFSQDPLSLNDYAVQNIEDLQETLDELEKYYESQEYEEQYSVNLMRPFAQVVHLILFYFAGNKEWFHGKEAELNLQIHKIAEMVYGLDRGTGIPEQNMIRKIRIMVFDLDRRMGWD